MEWSIVSKAADRSSRDRRETLSSSRAERRSLTILRRGRCYDRHGKLTDENKIDCWSTDGSRAGREQLSQGFWTGRRGLTLVRSFFKISGLRVVFLRRGFTIADLKADGKKAGVQKVIDDRCEVWKKIVKTMDKKRCWQRT